MKKSEWYNSLGEAIHRLLKDSNGAVYIETDDAGLVPLETPEGQRFVSNLLSFCSEGQPADMLGAATKYLLKVARLEPSSSLKKRFAWEGGKPVFHLGRKRVVTVNDDGKPEIIDSHLPFKQPDGYMAIEFMNRAKTEKTEGKKGKTNKRTKKHTLVDRLLSLNDVLHLDEQNFRLIVGWLLSVMAPAGVSIPILCIEGEGKTGKTTLARLLKGLLDLAREDVRALPSVKKSFDALTEKNLVLVLQSAKSIPEQLVIPICEVVEGKPLSGGAQFASDDFIEMPPTALVFDGGKGVLGNARLKRLAVVLETSAASRSEWMAESEMAESFKAIRQKVIVALLKTVYRACQLYQASAGNESLTNTLKWLKACDEVLGKKLELHKAFKNGFYRARLDADGDRSFVCAIESMLKDVRKWEGTPTQLLDDLTARNEGDNSDWPKGYRMLGRRLEDFREMLIERGIVMSRDASKKATPLKLVYRPRE